MPGAAAERRVVDLAAAQRRRARGSRRTRARARARARWRTWRWLAEPVEPLREEREDVDLHQLASEEGEVDVDPARRRRRPSGRRRAPAARAARRRRRARPRAPRTTAARSIRRTTPTSRVAVDDGAALELAPPSTRPPRAAARLARDTQQLAPRSASAASRAAMPCEPQDRPLGGAGAAHDRVARRPSTQQLVAAGEQRAARRASRGRSRRARAVGRPGRPASRRAQSTMSTRTRRLSLTAAALTTVRSAWAVRPPRPMTWP